MSDPKPKKATSSEPKSHGWMAEYDDENKLLDACRKVRDSGYTQTDAFAPFPIHGIDEALGIKPTVLPWFSFCAGITGTTIAISMQIWMNAIDYPYIISGKPYISLPAFIPVAFELTVLFAAFTTVFAMLGLNGLPKFSNPVFTNPRFDRATDDRFFLWIDASDKYFNSDKVRSLLGETGALEVEEVREDNSSSEVPKKLIIAILTGIAASLIPGTIILNMRNSKSSQSRFHVFFDMDYQPKRKTQTSTTLFADGRVQRPPVPGTVAFGELDNGDAYYLGYDPDVVADARETQTTFVSFQEDGADPGADAAATGDLNLPWIEEFPEGVVTDAMFNLGKLKFEQNCSVCHGYAGYGDGLVSQRAASLAQGYWVLPTSLHEARIQAQPVGRIYYTIANGKGKMGGYGASLNPKERWAVVLYVRALQRSQNAKASDVPGGVSIDGLAGNDESQAEPAEEAAEGETTDLPASEVDSTSEAGDATSAEAESGQSDEESTVEDK
ncbi:MAG: quinol:electron acceptor oxidoreductase subunit ActD [Aureliella sp.]